MKLKDYMESLEVGAEVTCWDNVIDSEFYFYKKSPMDRPVPGFLNVAKLDAYMVEHLDVKKIEDEGVTVGLYEMLENPYIVRFAKEHIYDPSQYDCDEDIVELLFDDMVLNQSNGYEEFSQKMMECFEGFEKEVVNSINELLMKFEISYEDMVRIYKRNNKEPVKKIEQQKYYEVYINLGSIEAGGYSIYIDGVSSAEEASKKVKEEGLFDTGSIEFVGEIDEETYIAGIWKNKTPQSWDDMKLKYPMDRYEMDEETEKRFVEDCFKLYEKEEFSSIYWSPFEDHKGREGQSFIVIGRCDENNAHISSLPMWNIKFKDGTVVGAYPEEVIPSEMRANGCKLLDEQNKSVDELIVGAKEKENILRGLEVCKYFIAEFSYDDPTLLAIVKIAEGCFKNYYSEEELIHGYGGAGPFESLEKAEKMLHKHRPTAKRMENTKEVQKLLAGNDKRKILKAIKKFLGNIESSKQVER